MAAGSSQAAHSTSAPLRKHDVFLSFYGKDTRKGFSDHLYTALKDKGIFVYRDNEELERGENISDLLKAIQESEYAVVIISENYAFSKWCLKELTEIVKCKKEYCLTILPVFYHVDPSNIRNHQKGSFANGLAMHGEESEENKEKWRSALREVSNIAGWHVHDSYESKIVQEIHREICGGFSHRLSNNFKDVVGIESQVKEMMTLLRGRANDAFFIGICGMGGVGKTTLAQVIFNSISSEFEATSFVEDVRKELEKNDIVHLQQKIIDEILGDKGIKIRNSFDGTSLIANRLQEKKIILILDNVDKASQIEALAKSRNWFGQGSRILLISRNKQLLKEFVDEIYDVKKLDYNDALRLFCLKAFKKNHPIKDFENLSREFVYYAQGLPLALKVFGSLLLKKELHVWKSTLKQLKEEPNIEIWDNLKISFDALSNSQQELFLDIACFFNGEPIDDDVMQYLEDVGYYPNSNIEVLQDRSLIKISNEKFKMHDLLQDIGQRIVRGKSLEDPSKWSRLWRNEDIIYVLKNNTGTNAIKGIFLRLPLPKPIKLSFEGFSKMKRLKMLVIRLKYFYDTNSDEAFECLRTVKWFGNPSKFTLSNELRILEWWGYPLELLPTNFEPDNLIKLKIPMSSIKHLWNAEKNFEKLKHIDLRDSQHLVEMPDFSGASNLEELDIKGVEIRQLSSSTIIPKKLNVLHIGGTSSKPISLVLHNFPLYLKFLRELFLSYCNLTDGALPSDLGCLSSLWHLDLSGNKFTKIDCLTKLPSLSNLVLKNCDRLKALPRRLSSPLYLIAVKKCSSLTMFSEPKDILTSSENLVVGDITLRGFYFGHDDKHFCTTHLARSTIRTGGGHLATVAWGPTLSSDIPVWFTGLLDISGMFQRHFEVEKGNYDSDDDFCDECDVDDYWGYALFIVYEVLGLDSCQRKGEINEVDENENFSSTISPVFVCELEVQKINDRKVPMDYASKNFWCISLEKRRSWEKVPREYSRTKGKIRIVFRVPDIPSVGRNGVWVFIGGHCFLEAGLKKCEDLGLCSISISSLNVEVKECGGRLVLNHDLSKCHDIIKSISPHDLDSEIAQSAFRKGIIHIDCSPWKREKEWKDIAQSAFRKGIIHIDCSPWKRGKEWKDKKNCPSLTSVFDPRYLLTSIEKLMARNIPIEAFYFGYNGKRYKTYHLAQSIINQWNPRCYTLELLLGRNFATVTWGPTLASDIPEWFTSLPDFSGILRFEAEKRPHLPELVEARSRYLEEFGDASLYYEVVEDPHLFDPFVTYGKFNIVSCWGYTLFIVYEVFEEIHEVDEYGNSSSTIFPMFVCELEVHEKKDPKVTNEGCWRNGRSPAETFEKVPGEYCRTRGKVPIVFRVPDIPSVGRNGVWVFINGNCFEKAGLERCDNLGLCSISVRGQNVQVKECGGRLVLKHDRSECYEIIKSISPHGLGSETLKDIFYGGGFTVFGDIIQREEALKTGKRKKVLKSVKKGYAKGKRKRYL